MSRYVKAEKALRLSVVYTDSSGRYFRHFGGTVAWRNHNPGNIEAGKISRRHNQIGVDNQFAIFPDYQSGHNALIDLIKTRYWNSSIPEMMQHYAPKSENDTASYIKFLQKMTGVTDNRKIKAFTANQFKKLWEGIERLESYKAGRVVEVYKITMTQITKNNEICAYFLENNHWINKKHCIALARKKQLELEICSSSLGNIYLRATGLSKFQKDLRLLVKK